MLYYIYLQPEVVRCAQDAGTYGLQALIGFLRGTIQNCALVEFEDYRNQQNITEFINNLPEDFDRKILKSLLSILQKRNRFIYLLIPDYSGLQSDISVVFNKANDIPIDLLLLEQSDGYNPQLTHSEICTLDKYQHTVFEGERSRLANEGKTFTEGQLSEGDFLNLTFNRIMRHVQSIEICDRIFGRQFGDNFEYTIKKLLSWLEGIIADPSQCKIIFYVGDPQKATLQYIIDQLSTFRHGRIKNIPIELNIYNVPDPDQCLPHERFIVTDQIAIEIGRGMDFLDRKTHKNRDVSIGYKNIKEVNDLISSYQTYKQRSVRF